MPAPNLMDPAFELGLYNSNTYVRGSAVEAVEKLHGVNAMKKVESDEINAKARVQQHASMDPLPYSRVVLTDEEEMAFDELIENNDEEESAASEENGDEGEPTGLEEEHVEQEEEQEGHELAVGVAAKMTEEKTTTEKMPEKNMPEEETTKDKTSETEKQETKPAIKTTTTEKLK